MTKEDKPHSTTAAEAANAHFMMTGTVLTLTDYPQQWLVPGTNHRLDAVDARRISLEVEFTKQAEQRIAAARAAEQITAQAVQLNLTKI